MSKYKILIFGGTGSLGSELVRFFTIKDEYQITVFSRDGHKQQALGKRFPDVRFILGDIRYRNSVDAAIDSQYYDFVINAAALKIVYQGEQNPIEFLEVNTIGAMNIARSCYKHEIPIMLQISTDKNVDPINTYGKTKALAEDIVIDYGYSALRYGNVFGSAGSVINIWQDQIDRGEKITVRTPWPTRFVLTLDDAVSLVDDALNNSHRNCIFVPKNLQAISMDDLARAIGITDWVERPLLPGEKQHEILVSRSENGYSVSDKLVLVHKGFEGNLRHADFCSETASQMSGKEFIRIFS